MSQTSSFESLLQEIEESVLAEGDEGSSKRRNVNPRLWGPAGWKFLDKVAHGYPDRPTGRDKLKMLEFLRSLGHVLPCARCRDSYVGFVEKYPPYKYLQNSRQLKIWLKKYKNSKD